MTDTPRTSRRGVWLVALGLMTAWVLFLLLFGPKGEEGELPRPRLGPAPGPARADYGWVLEDLDGRPVDFGRFRGRAVFLNFWATWCGPCRRELPAIASLVANPRLKRVAFVCASIDEDPAALRRFVTEQRLPLPVYRATAVPGAFLTAGIPATFLLAPDGTIVAAHDGPAQWDDPAVVDLLERLAGGEPDREPR